MNNIEKFCKKTGITQEQFDGRGKINGSLDLSSVTSIPEGFNPTVGGSLYLSSTSKYIGNQVNVEVETPTAFFWPGYAMIDGIFCKVKIEKTIGIEGQGYQIRMAGKIASKEEFIIVSHGNFHAHGKSIKLAFEDLQFKIQSHKLKKRPITEDTLVTVNHYRAITGACNLGCRDFMDRYNIQYTEQANGRVVEKSPMKAIDLLRLLEKDNAYGVNKFKKLIQ